MTMSEQEAGAFDAGDGVIIEFIDGREVPVEHKDFGDRAVVMRDAKHPEGPILYFTEAEWDAFIGGVKDGEFDDLLDDLPEGSAEENPGG